VQFAPARRLGREKSKQAEMIGKDVLPNFVILVWVCIRAAYDNRAMHTDKETDFLPWALAAIVVVIMGAAVALYPNESGASSSSVKSRETPPAATDQRAAIQKPQSPLAAIIPA
jgi:hypothetical protein